MTVELRISGAELRLLRHSQTIVARPWNGFQIDPDTRSRIRWFAEDYPFAWRTANAFADVANDACIQIGRALWNASLGDLETIPDLDSLVIRSDDAAVHGLPWELLRSSSAEQPLLYRHCVIRAPASPPFEEVLEDSTSEGMRLLFVSPRPFGDTDVPYSSLSRLARGAVSGRSHVVHCVRPTTFSAVGEHIKQNGPYDLLVFDGHGMLVDGKPVLVFDDGGDSYDLVDADRFAESLLNWRIKGLMLNTCRSAYSDTHDTPSFSLHLSQMGVPLVIGMAYRVSHHTARFYLNSFLMWVAKRGFATAACLARKELLSTYATIGRGHLHTHDWFVPQVYVSHPLTKEHFPASDDWVITDQIPHIPPNIKVVSNAAILQLDKLLQSKRLIYVSCMRDLGAQEGLAAYARWRRATYPNLASQLRHTSLGTCHSLNDAIRQLEGKCNSPENHLSQWIVTLDYSKLGESADVRKRVFDGIREYLEQVHSEYSIQIILCSIGCIDVPGWETISWPCLTENESLELLFQGENARDLFLLYLKDPQRIEMYMRYASGIPRMVKQLRGQLFHKNVFDDEKQMLLASALGNPAAGLRQLFNGEFCELKTACEPDNIVSPQYIETLAILARVSGPINVADIVMVFRALQIRELLEWEVPTAEEIRAILDPLLVGGALEFSDSCYTSHPLTSWMIQEYIEPFLGYLPKAEARTHMMVQAIIATLSKDMLIDKSKKLISTLEIVLHNALKHDMWNLVGMLYRSLAESLAHSPNEIRFWRDQVLKAWDALHAVERLGDLHETAILYVGRLIAELLENTGRDLDVLELLRKRFELAQRYRGQVVVNAGNSDSEAESHEQPIGENRLISAASQYAQALLAAKQYGDAQSAYLVALDAAKKDPIRLVSTLVSISKMHRFHLHDLVEAERYAREAYREETEFGWNMGEHQCVRNLCSVLLYQVSMEWMPNQQNVELADKCSEVVELIQKLDYSGSIKDSDKAWVKLSLGFANVYLGKSDIGIPQILLGLRYSTPAMQKGEYWPAVNHASLADVLYKLERRSEALAQAQQALEWLSYVGWSGYWVRRCEQIIDELSA